LDRIRGLAGAGVVAAAPEALALRDPTLAAGFARDFDVGLFGAFPLNRGDLVFRAGRLNAFFAAFGFTLVLVAIRPT
jgi:hypothetical protein